MPVEPEQERDAMGDAPAIGTCLAFDYGSKRIGTAVGERQLQSGRPLAVVTNAQGTPDWKAIDRLMEQWKPSALVVGWPLTESGEEQELTAHVRGFIKQLEKRYKLPVYKSDERYSSIAAQEQQRIMRRSGQRRRKTSRDDIDTLAAALILESWFATTTS